MDPRFSAQDVLRCDLCETPVPPMYCDFCHVKLCKVCVGEHLSDLSKEHKVVQFQERGSTPKYPKCPTHVEKLCELYCKECDLPVCLLCLSTNSHKGHSLLNLLAEVKSKQGAIQEDVDELLNIIRPLYENISAEIQREKKNLENQCKDLTTAVTKQGDDLHKEINIIVNKQKTEIDEMKIKYQDAINKHENEIQHFISRIKQCVRDLQTILDSNDVSLTVAYKSKNTKFKILPPKVRVSLPSFTPQSIKKEQLNQMFGALSALSITKEKYSYTKETVEAGFCPQFKLLLNEPQVIGTIDTEQKFLKSITCLSEEKFWVSCSNSVMHLYNLQSKLLLAIRTKSRKKPCGIAVTRSGDLVYTDKDTRTVNIVKEKQIQEVIKLQGWKPYKICSTSSDDLLVTIDNDEYTQTKVVRYSGSTEKQTIQFDSQGKPLFPSGYIACISENRNLDICVADCGASAVVVVNQEGKLRFRYTGRYSSTPSVFSPRSITTDSQSQILILDENTCIHILDHDGQFLAYIDNCDICSPRSLSIDTKDNLFVTERASGRVKKIKYMLTMRS